MTILTMLLSIGTALKMNCARLRNGAGFFQPKALMPACLTLNETDNAEYVILVRENPYHSLDEIILHELSHIARGDL